MAALFAPTGVAGASPDGVPGSWLRQATDGIRRAEYRFTMADDGELTAPNRAHDLRARLSRSGVTVTSRTRGADLEDDGWTMTLRLGAWGRIGALAPAGEALPIVDTGNAARVELRRDELTEWYVNDEGGLEQGFTLPARPAGPATDSVVIELELGGNLKAYPATDGQAIELRLPGGRPHLRYAGLTIYDAVGRALSGRMQVAAGVIRIVFDDGVASYPVIVDPLITSSSWTADGDLANASFGFSVSTAGDVNGDGYSDIVIGAADYDTGVLSALQGRAFVYHGSASGPTIVPDWQSSGSNEDSAHFGSAFSTAGDIDGDGYDEIIVGAPFEDGGAVDGGSAYVFHGSASGLSASFVWRADGDVAGGELGTAVGWAGDVNGDGFDDVIVGARKDYDVEVEEGRAYVWYGGPSGLGDNGRPSNADWRAEANSAGANFGVSVATAGDVDGDGFDDVVVGADQFDGGQLGEGGAFVWLGGPSGLGAAGTPANADWVAEGEAVQISLGASVATAGDVDGDGYADLLIGAPRYDNARVDEGAVLLYRGGATGLGANGTPSNADWKAEGQQDAAFLGASVATAGDVDGDGYADIVAGAPGYDGGLVDEGAALVWFGGPEGLGPAGTPANAGSHTEGEQAGAQFGYSVGAAGDIDGDGHGDVIVGARHYDDGETDEGKVWVYRGAASGLEPSASWNAAGGQNDAWLGWSVAVAGDVNGDGYSDLIVGAPLYDGGDPDEGGAFVYFGAPAGPSVNPDWQAEADQPWALFGVTVASAGDVNGDGYGDIIVGAPHYDSPELDEGRAMIWLGGVAGLGPVGTPANADWFAESDEPGAELGRAVAWAGDVNGDGFGDVLVGTPKLDKATVDEGVAALYLGSSAGPSSAPDWSSAGDQAGALYGFSVSSAGDVNGDGYSDILVGAHLYDGPEIDEGRAFLYHGSPTGPATTPDWTAELNQAGALFGHSVATAGDVNGDSFSDVIIGASLFDDLRVDEGGAFVWLGGIAGLGPNGTIWNADWRAVSGQPTAFFGQSVAPAGDVNGDGYGDVVVGASGFDDPDLDEGAAFVWYGAASGLGSDGTPSNADWSAQSDQPGALFGFAVAGAGDVNGDGFGDLVIGARLYDGASPTFPDEGGAFLYYGNRRSLMSRVPRQMRTDASAPIAALGISDDDYAFRVSARGRSAAGRTHVRLEWEVEPFGGTFNGFGLERGATLADTGPPGGTSGSSVEIEELVTGLAPASRYVWRLRTLSRSPYFPQSPWSSIPDNARHEADLFTHGFPDVDGDGAQSDVDCDDADPSNWWVPGDVGTLTFASDKQTLVWQLPSDPGGELSSLAYDTLRNRNPSTFVGGTVCIESDDSADRRATDVTVPPREQAFFYLVRAQNGCGEGSLGTRTGGAPRSGISCP